MSYEDELKSEFCKVNGCSMEDLANENVYRKYLHFGWWKYKREENGGDFHAAQIESMNADGAGVKTIIGIEGADECMIGTAEVGHGLTVACYSLSSLAHALSTTTEYDDVLQAVQDATEMFQRYSEDDPIVVDDL